MDTRAEREAALASGTGTDIGRGIAAFIYALIDGDIKITINVNVRDVTPKKDLR
jgi:hypothetical protein